MTALTLRCYLVQATRTRTDYRYQLEAATNLSNWKSHLLERTLRLSANLATERSSDGNHVVVDQPHTPEGQVCPRPCLAQMFSYNVCNIQTCTIQDAWGLYEPVLTCPGWTPVQRISHEKWVCNPSKLSNPCLIFSLGSNNEYSFEESVLKETPCSVHTYDCTVDGRSIDPERHFFHKQCVGSLEQSTSDDAFVTIDQAVMAIGASKLDLLKMDIELFEWDVIAQWQESDKFLPEQMSFEVHRSDDSPPEWPLLVNQVQTSRNDPIHWQGAHGLTIAHVSLLFMHLANLGYGLTAKELNAQCCAEFNVMRVQRDRSNRYLAHN